MASWAVAVYGLIKAIPGMIKLLDRIIDLYYQELDQAQEAETEKIQKEREALVASLKLDGLTAENRAIIRRRLYDLQK
jgi:RNA-binding protein YlmH